MKIPLQITGLLALALLLGTHQLPLAGEQPPSGAPVELPPVDCPATFAATQGLTACKIVQLLPATVDSWVTSAQQGTPFEFTIGGAARTLTLHPSVDVGNDLVAVPNVIPFQGDVDSIPDAYAAITFDTSAKTVEGLVHLDTTTTYYIQIPQPVDSAVMAALPTDVQRLLNDGAHITYSGDDVMWHSYEY